jgi:hypothetical protein
MVVIRIRLGKSLRNPPLWLLVNQDFMELVRYVNNPQVNLSDVEKLIDKVNEGLKHQDLSIKLKKAPPWSDYNYILVLVKNYSKLS